MQETVKKRAWVKDAAIIFLAVMLVLTFFSNTILNRSLPEAATVTIHPDSIDSKVRISGTATAKENYDVILDQTRKVLSVAVKVGQQVSTGDVLFTLEPGSSAELGEAQRTLRDAQLAYQRALINAEGAEDCTEQKRAVTRAQNAVTDAEAAVADAKADVDEAQAVVDEKQAVVDEKQAKYDALPDMSAAIETKEDEVKTAEDTVKNAQREVDKAQTGVNNSSDGSGGGYGGGASQSMYDAKTAAEAALNQAKADLNAANKTYGTSYDALKTEAKTQIANDYNTANPGSTFETLSEEDQNRIYNDKLASYMQKIAEGKDPMDILRVAYEEIQAAEAARDAAQEAYDAAVAAINDANSNTGDYYDPPKNYDGKTHSWWISELAKRQTALETAQDALEDRQDELQDLKDAQAKRDAAKTELDAANLELKTAEDGKKAAETAVRTAENGVKDAQDNVQAAQDALADAIAAAGKQSRLEALDLQEMQTGIADAQARVDELSGGDTATEVTSKVNGTVMSLTLSAGHEAKAGDVVATIEVPDLGYSMIVAVTNEQARLLHVGDTAKISNFYWGASTTAEITSIRPDPKNPQTGKQLTFDLTGDVTAGSTYNFSIGEKNANYDMVVPNSAVRKDANGDFILIITAKNSPLGNRYYATRVGVEIVASDDFNSAIKGALEGYETVITTTSNNAPVASGDQVRLADVNKGDTTM